MTIDPEAVARRTIDLCLSSFALVALSPLMGVTAILIRRDSPGPALFRQARIGRFGKTFTILKFRTMYHSTEQGLQVTASEDERITPLGARLRASKLDEVPQLFNVLRGDMSLVGPRPEVASFVRLWPLEFRETILSVRPGLTDPVTLALRNEQDELSRHENPSRFYAECLLPLKAKGYADYVQERNLLSDAVLILRTLSAISPKGKLA